MNKTSWYRIGEVSERLSLSQDTLRYYEKIGLLTVARSASGVRRYEEQDIHRLRFIRRAQKMNFSLAEISALLKMREDPQHARDEVRRLAGDKLHEVEQRVRELTALQEELRSLLSRCQSSRCGCPIIEGMETG